MSENILLEKNDIVVYDDGSLHEGVFAKSSTKEYVAFSDGGEWYFDLKENMTNAEIELDSLHPICFDGDPEVYEKIIEAILKLEYNKR